MLMKFEELMYGNRKFAACHFIIFNLARPHVLSVVVVFDFIPQLNKQNIKFMIVFVGS